MSIKIAVVGAAGRMGQRLVALGHEQQGLSIVSAVDAPEHPLQGRDAGELSGVGTIGVLLQSGLSGDPDVIIDFSHASVLPAVVEYAVDKSCALVVGTTGLTQVHADLLDKAAVKISVIQATNFSLVVNVLWKLAAEAAQLLGDEFDIEVMEAHHRFKKDAPSGTAMTLVEKLCQATSRDVEKDVVYTRHGHDALRSPRDITVQTLRIGDDPGQHTAYFAGIGERLEMRHVATSRDSYVLGALRAAKWLANNPAGLYNMNDVLGL